MGFKNKHISQGRLELVSLIDMIFILLVFFLVTSFVIRTPFQERALNVPTPENTLGRAQIVVQIIDEDRAFWLDEEASSLVEEIESQYGYLSQENLTKRIVSELIEENTVSYARLDEKLNALREDANQNPFSKYFVLVRCPNEVPYFQVVEVIAKVSNTTFRNVKYGCVGGTIDEIRSCRRISTVVERDEGGNRRKNIRIDF